MEDDFSAIKDLLLRLIQAIETQNAFPQWDPIITFLALIASWIAIAFLLIERYEKNRPYLQISFEPVRSTLACIVLRNTGNCALDVKSLVFSDEFIRQLPEAKQEQLREKVRTNITIFPARQWVISFDVNVFDILNRFDRRSVRVDYVYTKHFRAKSYKEHTVVDFAEYSGMLVYSSESDEFKRGLDKLSRAISDLTKVMS